MYLTVFSFASAVGEILCAVFMFWDSDVPYRDFLEVSQGILVTYGPSNPATWAIDPTDENAGAEFVVGHWLKVTFAPVGYRGAFAAIVAVYSVLGLALVFSWYNFFVLRENQLVISGSKPLQVLRALIQVGFGGLARIPIVGCLTNSYLSEYKRLARALANLFELKEFKPQMGFHCWWDGSLSLSLSQDGDLNPVE